MKTYYNESKEQIDNMLVEDLISEVNGVLNQSENCNIAIAGGRSIASVLDVLVTKNLDWQRLHVFAVDDRCLPIDDEESNSYLIQKHLADEVSVNFYPFTYSPDSPDRGASEYTDLLNEHGGKFDLLILSAGEDGHTAGLFPRNQGFNSQEEGYVFINDSPKPPAERISVSKNTFLKSNAAFIMFVGEGKREAYERFLDQEIPVIECPAKLVQQLPKAYLYTDLLNY